MKTFTERYDSLKDKKAVGAEIGVANVDLYFRDSILLNTDPVEAETNMVNMEAIDIVKSSEQKVKKDKVDADNISLALILPKIKDGSAKLEDVLKYIEIKENL